MERSATRTEIVDEGTIDPVVAVRVSGELDLATIGDLEERVERAMGRGSSPLLIDFTDCGFIDCSVLPLLVKLRLRIGESVPPRFAVIAGDQPLRVLRLTQLDREIAIFATLADALGALRGGALSHR